jgi:hypothetical protein
MHRSLWLRVIALPCVLLVCACAKAPTSDIKTAAAADETIKFSGYKTYGWFAGVGLVKDDTGRWDNGSLDVGAELKFNIDKALRDRGLNESSANPQLLISYLIAANIDQLKEIEGRGGDVSSVEGVGKSALVVELVDASTQHTVWVGAAAGDAQTGRSTGELKERLDYAVTEVFKALPRD